MKTHFGRHYNEPVWRPNRCRYQIDLAADIADWLFDRTSLTKRLQDLCSRFSIKVLDQGWDTPMLNEARALGISTSRNALIRQVHLLCDDQPWVYARTVIPAKTLIGCQRRLASLGTKSLGAVLFADKSMRREEIHIARITPGQQIYVAALAHVPHETTPIWGRRSVFRLHRHPLLVSEVFLPKISYCKNTTKADE